MIVDHESAYGSVNDAIAGVAAIQTRHPASNIYFTVSAQAEGQTRIVKTANGDETKPRYRSKAGATLIKDFVTDLDVKASGYESPGKAALALKAFIEAVSLPRPTAMIASGTGGFHAHWILKQAITPEAWQPIANRFVEAQLKFGLITDRACTKNVACLFRVPDTYNHKTTPPTQVMMAMKMSPEDLDLDEITGPLEAYLNPSAPADVPALPATPSNVISMQTGRPVTAPVTPVKPGEAMPRALVSMTEACSFVGEGLESHGRAYGSEPEWAQATMLAVFTEEGVDAAHLLASGSPYYVPADVDKKFDEKRTARDNGAGWPSCHAIHDAGWSKCQSCPNFNPDKAKQRHGGKQSPLHFGKPSHEAVIANATAKDEEMPRGYDRRNGIIGRLIEDEDGKTQFKPLCGYPMEAGVIYAGVPNSIGFDTLIGPRRVHITLTFQEAVSDKLRSVLAGQEMILSNGQAKLMGDFLVAWLTHLQRIKEAVTGEPFGWNVENGKIIGYAWNSTLWTPTGPRRTANSDPELRRAYTPVGDIAPWKAAVERQISEGRQCVNMLIAAAFAGPLVKMLGYGGLLLSSYSTASGIGKTVAAKSALAVWGHPKLALMQLSDTHNYLFRVMGQMNSTPAFWDELKDQSQNDDQVAGFVTIVQQLTNGREKGRLDNSASAKLGGSWNTLLTTTSNTSLAAAAIAHSRITPASLVRVFEVPFTPGTEKTPAEKTSMARLIGQLDDNYGRAGEIYAEFLGRNHEAIAKKVADFQDAIAAEVMQDQDERFWTATIAALLAGAYYAKVAGLCDIPLKPLKEFLVGELNRMREERKEVSVDIDEAETIEGILGNYIRDNQRRTMIATDEMPMGQGKPKPAKILFPSDLRMIDRVAIQYAIGPKILRMTVSDLDRWLSLQRLNAGITRKRIKQVFGARVLRAQIAGGTEFGLGREQCIDISIAGTALAETLGEHFTSDKVIFSTIPTPTPDA